MNVFGRHGFLRGCFVKFQLDALDSKGTQLIIYDSQNQKTILPNNSSDYLAVVITGVELGQQESVGRLKCFRSRVYTYAFGADVGSATVSFTTFLNGGSVQTTAKPGSAAATVQSSSDVMAKMLKLYRSGRVSQSRQSAILNMGTTGEIVKGQIDSFRSATQDLEHNIQSIQLGMTTIPDPEQDRNN